MIENLKFAFKRSNSQVAYCAISFATGTRNEDQKYAGLAHLTEHMFFKGTKTRTANSINSFIEKLGGELNAYTTKEETVLHATVLKEDISKAINLLVDIAFCSILPEKELEKEKLVVLDEINSYKDSPSEQIFDDFEENLFKDTPLSMPVLGKSKTIRKINRDVMLSYYKDNFIPGNMGISVVADMQEQKAHSLFLKAMQKYDVDIALVDPNEKVLERNLMKVLPFEKIVSKRGYQTHCIIGAQGYSYYDKRRIPLILFVNILGGPAANSKLNLLLREKHGLVYSVDASFNQYSDTGSVAIYFGCDKSNYLKCVDLIDRELTRFRENLMTDRALREAKKQLLGQLAISSDNGEAQCLSMGKSLLVFGRVMDMEQIRAKVEAVTAEDILAAVNHIFAKDKLSQLLYK